MSQDVEDIGQNPYTGFAETELSEVSLDADPPRVRLRFFGVLWSVCTLTTRCHTRGGPLGT